MLERYVVLSKASYTPLINKIKYFMQPAARHPCTLFASRRFLPLFLAQFLGAMNDNLLRSGLVVLIAYAGTQGLELPIANQAVLVTLCSALLVVPFILFSFLAGQLADRMEKSRLILITKAAEILIMLVAAYGFATANIYLLMLMLFISGTHSTFFGPLKYSILPDHLNENELIAGNGFVASGTYLGVLSGLIGGGLLALKPDNLMGVAVVCVACLGFLASLFIPKARAAHPEMKMDYHVLRGTLDQLRYVKATPALLYGVLGLSWFLLLGSVFMSQFPNYAQAVVRGNEEVYTLFLTLFSVGIAAGSVACNKLLKGEVTARLTPLALLGVTVFTYALVLLTPAPHEGELLTALEFLQAPMHWPLLFCMLMVAVCGGVYMVPLYAILQARSDKEYRSRVMAVSNFCDSLFMTVFALISAVLLATGLGITGLFTLVATINLGVAFYAWKILSKHR